MASENEVGIGFAARDSGFVSVMQQMVEATQNLTSTITGLNNILTNNASALNAVEQAHQKSATSTLADVTSIQSLTNAETSAGAASQTRLAQLMQEADQRERVASIRQQLASRATEEVNVTNQEGESIQTLIMRHGGLVDVIDRETGSVITSTAAGQAAIAAESSRTEQLLAQVAAMNNVAESENRDAVSAELLAKSQDELNQMVAAGVITGEQYRAVLDSQIDARARETAATVQQTAVQTEQNNALSQSWEKVMMTMGKTGTESPAIALEAINTAAANGVAPLTMQKQLLQDRFNLVQQWIQSGEVTTWQELDAQLKKLDQTTNATTGATRQHITEMRGARFEVMALMMVMMEFNTVLDGNTKNMTVVREGTMAMANALMVYAMIPGNVGIAVAALTATVGALGIVMHMVADEDISALNKELDTLGQKDNAAMGLAKVANVTTEQAQAAIDAAKKNADYAQSLVEVAKSAETTGNLGDTLSKGFSEISKGMSDATAAGTPLSGIFNAITSAMGLGANILISVDTAFIKVIEDMAQGKLILDIAKDAWDTFTGTFNAQSDAAKKAAESNKELRDLIANPPVDPYKDLDSSLANLAKHDDAAVMLAKISGASKEEAAFVLDSGSKHKELGAQLAADVKLYEDAQKAIDQATAAHQYSTTAINQEGEAAKRVAADIAALNQAEIVSAADEANKKIATDRQKYTDDTLKAARDLGDQLKEIEYQRGQNVIKQTQADTKAQEEYNTAVMKANRDTNDAIFKAQRDLTDAMIDDAQKLADSKFKAQRSLSDSLADDAYQHLKQEQDIANQNVTNQRNAANDIAKAYRDMLQSLADSDWNTSQSLQNAKTENERNQIEQRAMHERAGIREKFGNTVEDINNRIAEENRVSKIKQDLADQDYQHAIMVDQRKNAEALADAQRTYNEEIAKARRRDAEMIDDAHTRNAQQLADAQTALNAKLAADQLALENENKALDHQVELDKQRNKERLDDFKKTLDEEVRAVLQNVSTEVAAYMMVSQMRNAITAGTSPQDALSMAQGAMQMQEQLKVLYANNAKQMTGRAGGGEVTAGQPYIVGESGRELFIPSTSGTVVPNSSISTSYGGHTFNVTIVSNNPDEIWEALRKRLSQEAWRP